MRLKWDFEELYDFAGRLGNADKFEEFAKTAVKQLAKDLHEMLIRETPVKTGKLKGGWEGAKNYSYTITTMKTGYKVELINEVKYAKWVNDGHDSYNQFGGPYEVNDDHRTVPYTQGKNHSTFVFGHFFVEKSILKMENDETLNTIIADELDKWFRWCVNGK